MFYSGIILPCLFPCGAPLGMKDIRPPRGHLRRRRRHGARGGEGEGEGGKPHNMYCIVYTLCAVCIVCTIYSMYCIVCTVQYVQYVQYVQHVRISSKYNVYEYIFVFSFFDAPILKIGNLGCTVWCVVQDHVYATVLPFSLDTDEKEQLTFFWVQQQLSTTGPTEKAFHIFLRIFVLGVPRRTSTCICFCSANLCYIWWIFVSCQLIFGRYQVGAQTTKGFHDLALR